MKTNVTSVKTLIRFLIINFTIFLSACNSQKDLVYNDVKNQTQCQSKKGYWYHNTCWKDYEEESIPKSKIDSTVSAQMKIINTSELVIDGKKQPLVSFLPIEEKQGLMIAVVYGKKNNYKSFMFLTGKKEKELDKQGPGRLDSIPFVLFEGDLIGDGDNIKQDHFFGGISTIKIKDLDNLELEISGTVNKEIQLDEDTKKTAEKNITARKFTFNLNEAISGAGNSYIEIKGNEAWLSGDLGTITYMQIKDLIKNHPDVKTIVMGHISGSVNDAVNMHTGILLRENDFTTKVLSNSDIASGGVDLFCAGVNRIVEEGAKIGVHSWCCVNGLTAIELPEDHPAHKDQLKYFTMMLGPKKGPAFYFYTLHASPFDDVHYMNDEEIKKWGIATEFIQMNK